MHLVDQIVTLECHILPIYNSTSLQSSCQDREAVSGKGGGFYFCQGVVRNGKRGKFRKLYLHSSPKEMHVFEIIHSYDSWGQVIFYFGNNCGICPCCTDIRNATLRKNGFLLEKSACYTSLLDTFKCRLECYFVGPL